MRIASLFAALLLLGSPAAAQDVPPLAAAPVVNWSQSTTPFVNGPVLFLTPDPESRTAIDQRAIAVNVFRPEPGRIGILFWMPGGTLTIAVWHARSGYIGGIAAPGFCFESFRPTFIDYRQAVIADVNGDGRDDVITLGNLDPRLPVQPLYGQGLQFCR